MNSSTASLINPDTTQIQVVDSYGEPLPLANLLLSVQIFANHKNDFVLQPFTTDGCGLASIAKKDIMAEVAAHYDSGVMDYVTVESAKPQVEIAVMAWPEIQKALHSRTNVWKTLLRGESLRWTTIDDLLDVYRTAANDRVIGRPVSACWDTVRASVEYSVQVGLR